MNPKSQVKHSGLIPALHMIANSKECPVGITGKIYSAISESEALIAAAPELLEALKAMRDCGSMEEAERNKLFDKAEAAIHRAEGGK